MRKQPDKDLIFKIKHKNIQPFKIKEIKKNSNNKNALDNYVKMNKITDIKNQRNKTKKQQSKQIVNKQRTKILSV